MNMLMLIFCIEFGLAEIALRIKERNLFENDQMQVATKLRRINRLESDYKLLQSGERKPLFTLKNWI